MGEQVNIAQVTAETRDYNQAERIVLMLRDMGIKAEVRFVVKYRETPPAKQM